MMLFYVRMVVLCAIITECYCFCPFQRREREVTEVSVRPQKEEKGTELLGFIPMATDMSDPLVRMNEYFHSAYDEAKDEMVPKVNIMLEGDYLVLHLSDGTRLVEQISHDIYHNLKMVSHIPLGAYTILLGNSSQSVSLDQLTLGKLSAYLELLADITISDDRFSDPNMLARQQDIFDGTVLFVKKIISSKECSLTCMSDFAWSMSTAVNLNLNDAAEDTINSTHVAVMNWKENVLTKDEWNDLYIAVTVG